MTSPARAGSTPVAANPTAVARKELPKLTRPSGSSSTASEGADRKVEEHRGERQRQPLIFRVDDGRDDAAQIDVVQEQRDKGGGERDDDRGPQVRAHGT